MLGPAPGRAKDCLVKAVSVRRKGEWRQPRRMKE